jgi:hypothetical protein
VGRSSTHRLIQPPRPLLRISTLSSIALSGLPLDYENLLALLVDSSFIQLDNQHTMDSIAFRDAGTLLELLQKTILHSFKDDLMCKSFLLRFLLYFFSFLTMFSLLALSLDSEHFVSALKLDWTILWIMDGMA